MINWYSVALSAFVGALASIIATLVFSNRTESKITFYVFVLVLFVSLNNLAKHYLLIPYEIAKAKRNFTETTEIQLLKKYVPSTFNSIMHNLDVRLKNEQDTQFVISQMRSKHSIFEINYMLQKRLATASDDAVLTYISVKIREIRELNKQNPEICMKALAPQVYGIDMKDLTPKELADADRASFDNVIKSSIEQPQPVPSRDEVSIDMNKALSELNKKHPDIAFAYAASSPSNFNDACNVVAELYETITAKLPPERSSKVIRYIYSQIPEISDPVNTQQFVN